MEKTYKTKDITLNPLKGQKIVAALYLVTNHLTDTDPLKHAIRTHAIALLDVSGDKGTCAKKIADLIGAAVLAGIIGKQNAAILTQEISAYIAQRTDSDHAFGTLFAEPVPRSDKRDSTTMSFMSDNLSLHRRKYDAISTVKSKRQQDILSFINERKSVAIKDIAQLFPDVSEKTIQRELSMLVHDGKITKRGSKRWSIYLAV